MKEKELLGLIDSASNRFFETVLPAVAAARTVDSEGIPEIGGLDDLAMIRFGKIVNEAREYDVEQATCILESLAELARHHPALQPEVGLIFQIQSSCFALWAAPPEPFPDEHLVALKLFQEQIEPLRAPSEVKIEEALERLAHLGEIISSNPALHTYAFDIKTLCNSWRALIDSPVMERHRRN